MGLFKDEQGNPKPEGDNDFRLPAAAEEDDVTEQIRRNPDPEPSGVSEMSFDDDEHEEDYLDEDLEDLPEPDTYISRRSGSGNRKKPASQFKLGKGPKLLGFAAAVVGVMVILMAAFGGGGESSSPTTGPTEGELAASNQQKVEERARELMEERLEIRQKKVQQIRAKRAAARKQAEAEREAELAAAKAKRKAAAAEAAKAETTVVSEPESSYTPPPTYTYTPPPAPAPEPAPAPAPEPAPVETQAQVNQSTANSSFGFGG